MTNGNGHVLATDGRSRFARLWRDIEKELLAQFADTEVFNAQEHVRFIGPGNPYYRALAKLSPQEFLDTLQPATRRRMSQKARMLALKELRLDREISEFCDGDG